MLRLYAASVTTDVIIAIDEDASTQDIHALIDVAIAAEDNANTPEVCQIDDVCELPAGWKTSSPYGDTKDDCETIARAWGKYNER